MNGFIFGDSDWHFPITGDKGFIEDNFGMVLTVNVNNDYFSVTDQPKITDGFSTQMWFRSRSTIDGYCLLESGELHGHFLTGIKSVPCSRAVGK